MFLYIFAITFLAYCIYRITSWYRRIRAIGAQVDKLPGDDPHWLFGNLKKVSQFIDGSRVSLAIISLCDSACVSDRVP